MEEKESVIVDEVDPLREWKKDATLQYVEGSLLWRLAELCVSMREEEISDEVLNFKPDPKNELEWAGDLYVRRIYYEM